MNARGVISSSSQIRRQVHSPAPVPMATCLSECVFSLASLSFHGTVLPPFIHLPRFLITRHIECFVGGKTDYLAVPMASREGPSGSGHPEGHSGHESASREVQGNALWLFALSRAPHWLCLLHLEPLFAKFRKSLRVPACHQEWP